MNRLQEFWYCVSSQNDLPLYKGQSIEIDVCTNLISFINHYKNQLSNNNDIHDFISKSLLKNPDMIKDIRLLLGISDKRLYLDLTYLSNIYRDLNGNRLFDYEREDLVKHDTKFFISQLKKSEFKQQYADLISTYFIQKDIKSILSTFSELSDSQITQIFNNLIAPKEIQQKQAKYRGHGAEMEFSKIFKSCGMNIFPSNKHLDPMAGYDPNVDLSSMSIVPKDTKNPNVHSFDLIIKDSNGKIKILVQSLIHSSDPGQYGVNKSDETLAIMELVKDFNNKNPNNKVYLLGSVDGVGFSENPNGTIAKMLDVFDEFFQIHTLFKIGIFLYKINLIDNLIGVSFDTDFFEPYFIEYLDNKYLNPLGLKNLTNLNIQDKKCLKAGKAILVFN